MNLGDRKTEFKVGDLEDGIKRFKGINEIFGKYSKIVKELKTIKSKNRDDKTKFIMPDRTKSDNTPSTPCVTPDLNIKSDFKLNNIEFKNVADRIEQIPSPFSDNKMNSRENIDLNIK